MAASLASIASTEDNEATKVDDAGQPVDGGDSGGGSQTFGVGDTVALGEWQVKVHAVTDPLASTNEFLTPSEGNRWVAVDVEVMNKSQEPATVSSILCFEVQDSENKSYNMTITGDSTAASPDGEVDPGGARRGTIVYEVPNASTGLTLRFKCDLLSTGTAIIGLGSEPAATTTAAPAP